MKYIDFIKDHDPAAYSTLQVLFLYPSVKAMFWFRISHFLYKKKFKFIALYLMNRVKRKTGIEIHPMATIGKNLFIDHGVGVVIGETAIIGDNCVMYQGVVLGGTGKEKGKRHPTIKNNVMLGAGSILLGNITIGNNVKIGANTVVLEDVEDGQTIIGIKGKIKNYLKETNNL